MAELNQASSTTESTRPASTDQSTADTETTDRLTCPECTADGIVDDEHGEAVCPECGFIIEEEIVDRGPEWRAFNPGEKREKSRVGAPTTDRIHDKGLSSVIGWRDEDASGQALSSRQRKKMQRLRTWDERFRTRDDKERNLKQALGEIERMASAIGLPDPVRETASVIYRRALDADLLPGRSIEAVATASLYAAARQTGTPRSLDEFKPISRVPRKEYARAYRYIVRELGLAIEPADPEEYIPRFASELALSEEAERQAHELLQSGKANAVHSGKSPVGLAAAAIYAGAKLVNESLTQQDLGAAADVSEVTIRNRYTELLDAADDFPT